ncbi:hypothetical protein BY996DRAFT_8400806 [Phakopsora pachyrhizi]|nr:hypothetical protein BY996DRAFT_8400806 [Phakopsora pachyrhizi]
MLIKFELNIIIFIFLRECKGMFPFDAHSLFTNELLNFSIEGITSSENKWRDVGKGIETPPPKLSSNSENDLFKDISWDGGKSFDSYLETSFNFIPVDDNHHTDAAIEALNHLPPYFSGDDLFEGIGWDGKQTFASLLEPDDSLDSPHSQNHSIVLPHYIEDPVPLEHNRSAGQLNPEHKFNLPSTGKSSKVAKQIVSERHKNCKSYIGVKKQNFKKQNMPLNLKTIGTPLLETIGGAQTSLFKDTEKTVRIDLPKPEKFTPFWWKYIYLTKVVNSITKGEDTTLRLQVFLDRMDELADDLVSSYKDETFWNKMNMNYKHLLTKIVTKEHRSDNFKTNIGEIMDQGVEPYHISLIKKFKKNASMAGSPRKLSRFLPLFDAMEILGKETGVIYFSSKTAHDFFVTKQSERNPMDCLGKVQSPRVDENFYQALNTQLINIKFEEYFKRDGRILRNRALLTYIEQKVVPVELKAFRKILKGKLLMRNLYLVITTLINKFFCEGYDDLKQNFSKRQKVAIEFYDLVWKSFRLTKLNKFINQ